MSTHTANRCTSLSRRSFLLTLAGAAGSIIFASGCQRFVTTEPVSRPWSEWLLDAYNRASVGRLGQAYRAAHPEESSAEVLADSIDRALAQAGVPGTAADPGAHSAMLQTRVHDEYTRGEAVRLNGWIVSVTEARLYALVSLDSAASGES